MTTEQKELILSENQKQHGGPRPNSGRPPKDNARMPAPMRLLPDTVEFLKQSGPTLAEATETIIRKSKAFREWQKSRPIPVRPQIRSDPTPPATHALRNPPPKPS